MDQGGEISAFTAWEQLDPSLRAEWSKRLEKIGMLPMLAGSASVHMPLDSLDARALAARVGQDPVLAGKLLAVANSAKYGLITQVTSVQRAIVHLGYNLVKTILVAREMEVLFAAVPRFPMEYLMAIRRWAAGSSVLAYHWAQADELPDASTLGTLALLSRLGNLALGLAVPQPDDGYLALPDEPQRLEYEQAAWRITSPVLSSELARRWALPDPLPALLGRQAEPFYSELAPGPESRMLCLIAASSVLTHRYLENPETKCGEPLDEPAAAVLKTNLTALHLLDGLPALWASTRMKRELSTATEE